MQFDNTVRLILESAADVRYIIEKVSKEIIDQDDYKNFVYTSYTLTVKDREKGMMYEVNMDWLIPNSKILNPNVLAKTFDSGSVWVLEPNKKGKGTHGQMIHTGKTIIATDVWGGTQDKFENTLEREGLKHLQLPKRQYGDLKLLGRFLDKITLEDLEILIHVGKKPETKKHFGDIVTEL
jgi:hypothetical protein